MKKEIKIGLVVMVGFAILIWGVNFLKGRNIFSFGDEYYGVYGRLDGLAKASPVAFRGFKIGSVQNIEFHPTLPNKFVVTFSLDTELELPKDTRAQIYSLDLMGSKGVQFIPGKETVYLAAGDTMVTSVMGDLKDQVSMEVLPLKDKAERLIVKLDSVLTNVGRVFSEDNQSNLSASIENFNRSMRNFERLSSNLARKVDDDGDVTMMVKRMDSVMMMVAAQRPYIDTTFRNLAGFSSQLEQAQFDEVLGSLKSTLENTTLLLNNLNEGNGSLGLLLSDKELYYSLTEASASLNHLLIDVRHNPDRYVNFSAVNLGKKVYVTDGAYGVKGVFYQVELIQSPKPLNMDSVLIKDKYKVFEDYREGDYVYSIGQARNYDEILKIHEEVKADYENSRVVAFENGEVISIKKALRKTK
ncbi:MAG: MCE family protein [Marinilabiliaceae bacterium]|nr:MCE family protein [Marinilabiliaceae bacterium]